MSKKSKEQEPIEQSSLHVGKIHQEMTGSGKQVGVENIYNFNFTSSAFDNWDQEGDKPLDTKHQDEKEGITNRLRRISLNSQGGVFTFNSQGEVFVAPKKTRKKPEKDKIKFWWYSTCPVGNDDEGTNGKDYKGNNNEIKLDKFKEKHIIREDLLGKIDACFAGAKINSIKRLSVSGLGGAGKNHLVYYYFLSQYKKRYPIVLWFSDYSQYQIQYNQLYEDYRRKTKSAKADFIKKIISGMKEKILVVVNCNFNLYVNLKYLPEKKMDLIVISRIKQNHINNPKYFTELHMSSMSPEEAKALFENELELLRESKLEEFPDLKISDPQIQKTLKFCFYFPLAIMQVLQGLFFCADSEMVMDQLNDEKIQALKKWTLKKGELDYCIISVIRETVKRVNDAITEYHKKCSLKLKEGYEENFIGQSIRELTNGDPLCQIFKKSIMSNPESEKKEIEGHVRFHINTLIKWNVFSKYSLLPDKLEENVLEGIVDAAVRSGL